MEDCLRALQLRSKSLPLRGLNPCFSGRLSASVAEMCHLWRMENVLILVLVEDCLREVEMQLADLQTFMCEKWPKFQKSHEKKYIFCLRKYNFFRLNNMFFCFFSSKKSKTFSENFFLCGFIKFYELAYGSHVGFRKTVSFWIL